MADGVKRPPQCVPGEVKNKPNPLEKDANFLRLALFLFIREHWNDYDHDRLREHAACCNVVKKAHPEASLNRSEFLEQQKKALAKMSDEDIIFYGKLYTLIKRDVCSQMDKDDYIVWGTSAFYFDSEGELVLFHER